LPLRDTIERVFAQRPDLMGMETPPATVKLDLAPEVWRKQRAALVRQKEWRRRLLWAGGAYVAAFLLFALYAGIIRFQVGHLQKAIRRDAPKVEFIRRTEADWKALSPAIDPHYYPIEVLLHLFESLPNPEVRITVYDQSARNISVQGEAPSAALAYQFAEKVKKHPGLQAFTFNLGTPRICLTTTRNSGWRGKRNDRPLARPNESTGADARPLRRGILFLLINLAIWSALFGMSAGARADYATQRATRTEQTVYLGEEKMWKKRAEWLKKKQSRLNNPAEASTLLTQVKQIAGKYNVQIDNPQIGAVETTPSHQAVSATFETKSDWGALVHFLYDVQRPEAFTVFEQANLMIDASDPTVMRGRFKIAKWFAPGKK
jgi:hypothetical protein